MQTRTNEPCDPFGPDYNVDSPTLRKFRRASRSGLGKLAADDRRAYGAAVHAAVLAAQRGALARVTKAHTPNCNSGTPHSDGAKIHAAILRRQERELLACPGQIRRARTDDQWRTLYEAAMAEKRKREGTQNRKAA
jgi:hypothetical protein